MRISAVGWVELVYSGIFVIGLGYLLWGRGVQRIGSTRTSLYSNLVTIVAVAIAIVVLGEKLLFCQDVGVVAVIGGLVLARLRA
jgi:drug/metabolite transporter (DMT)-like permease